MPQAARTFRIFVSSTFNDLKAERNALQDLVYPKLKELCERHGTRFQAIDLRWGVSEEAAKDQQTINICLTEVDRCRDTSPRPNFIVLLGDRYGWRPPPPQIEAEEFEAIRDRLSPDRKALLDECYLKDDNAVPPEYCLRERDDGFYEDFDDWDPIERELTLALRSGAAAAGLGPDEMMKYVASATEQEIERGALSVEDAREHVFCFFRRITNLEELIDDIPEERVKVPPETTVAEDFVDLHSPTTDRSVDTDASEQLGELKGTLRSRLPRNIHDYEARWTGHDGAAAKTGLGELSTGHIFGEELPASLDEWLELNEAENPPENLCVDVWRRLSRVILAEIAQLEKTGELDKEIAAHEKFGKDRARFFVRRFFTTGENAVERIAGYVAGTDPHPFAVAAVSGSGKSALIARAAIEAESAEIGAVLVRRFIGATAESSVGRALLASLCEEVSRAYGTAEPVPADYRELVEEFPKRLALAEKRGTPLVLFLDALDQLVDADGARSLTWLPAELPGNVRVVVSALRADLESEAPAPKGSECYATLAAKLPAGNLAELKPMTKDEGARLLELWLSDERAGRRRRTLTEDQRTEVLSKFAAEGTEAERAEPQGLPLYLKLAFEEARRWHSYSPAEETVLTPTLPGIIRKNLFTRLSRDENHGEVMVSRSLGYLGAARNGLSEDELLDVLSDEKVLRDFKRRSPKSLDVWRLPVVVWSRLYFDLEPYLGERSADGASLLSFYHRQLAQVVAEDYLVEDGERLARDERRDLHDGRARHSELTDYFADDARQPLVREADDKRMPNLRRLSELPFQAGAGHSWPVLDDTLCTPAFPQQKRVAGLVGDLADDYRRAIAACADAAGADAGLRTLLVGLGTARRVALVRAASLTDTDLQSLVTLGREDDAVAYARLRAAPIPHMEGLQAVCLAQIADGRSAGSTLAAMDEAMTGLTGVAGIRWRTSALVLRRLAGESGPLDESFAPIELQLAQTGAEERWRAAVEIAESIPGVAPDSLARGILERIASAIGEPLSDHSYLTSNLAVRLAERGLARSAIRLARSVPEADRRQSSLGGVVGALAERGETEAATGLLGELSGSGRDGALPRLAAKVGDPAQAADMARQCEDPIVRAEALAKAAAAAGSAASHLADEAIETARQISDAYEQSSALVKVACALAEAGLTAEAERATDLAAVVVPTVTGWTATMPEYAAPNAYANLVKALIAVDRLERAEQVVHSGRLGDARIAYKGQELYLDWLIGAREYAKALAFAGKTSDRYGTRGRLLSNVAAAQAADGLLEEAAQTVDSIEDEYWRRDVLKVLAERYAATSMYDDAERVLEAIDDEEAKAEAVRSVVGAMLDRNLSMDANELFVRVREADVGGNAVAWAGALREAALAYALAGRREAAGALFELAEQAAEAVSDLSQAPCLRDLALAYVAADAPSDAAKVIERLWTLRENRDQPLDMSEERDLMSLGSDAVRAANAVADAMAAHGHVGEAKAFLSSLRPLYYSHGSLTDPADVGRAPADPTAEEPAREVASTDPETLWASGRLNDALDALSECDVDDLLRVFAVWSRRPEMGVEIEALSKAIEIGGWVRRDWRSLAARVGRGAP